ncbi:MAG: hypothetical protein ACRDF4_00485 [Rhabdochlamydiaceae bacterium]
MKLISLNSRSPVVSILVLFVFAMTFAHSPIISSGSVISSASSSASDPCSSAFAQDNSDPSIFSNPAAINLALNSPELKSATAGSSLTYSSTFHLFHYDLTTGGSCTLQSVNVVFDMSNGSQAVVSENPTSTQVVGVSLQTGNPNYGPNPSSNNAAFPDTNTNWAGYTYNDVQGSAYSTWIQPTAKPDCPYVGGDSCGVSFWVGQTAQYDGQNGIAQGGSEGLIYVTVRCCHLNIVYDIWYEYWIPNQPSSTSCHTINAGDTVATSVVYDYNLGYYDIDVTGGGWGCITSQQMSMGQPYYSQFVAEWPTAVGWHPENFGSVTFSQCNIGGTGIHTLSVYHEWTNTGMSVGSVSSSDSFTVTYTGSL